MESVNISQSTVLASLLIANIASLIGFFISLKVSNAVLQVKVDRLEKDVNNLGKIIRREHLTSEEQNA